MPLEHVNVTVSDPRATADLLEQLFDWHTRWHGPSLMGGHSIHVGDEHAYVALYAADQVGDDPRAGRDDLVGLNHIGVVVDDLDEVARRVAEVGIESYHHMDYEPGRRFYFRGPDDIEFEVVSYA
ncbi:MAG: VOC family protein [Acidimicrobiia bacterium]|nr:VOC family protein [Acidimicrobiia bacterium]